METVPGTYTEPTVVPTGDPSTGEPRKRRPRCHTVIDGQAVCGARLKGGGLHSLAACKAGRHDQCGACELLGAVEDDPRAEFGERG